MLFPSPLSSETVSCLLRLEKLVLRRIGLEDLAFLALCPKVKTFHFTGRADMSMLTAVPELRSLKLEVSAKLDLSSLRSLTKLQRLEVKSTERWIVQSVYLPPLPSLHYLDMSDPDDWESICERQPLLSTLIVRCCSQEDIDRAPVLAALPHLQKLSLTFPTPRHVLARPPEPFALDLSPLRALSSQLRSLSLIHGDREDLEPLTALTKLEALDLSASKWVSSLYARSPTTRSSRDYRSSRSYRSSIGAISNRPTWHY